MLPKGSVVGMQRLVGQCFCANIARNSARHWISLIRTTPYISSSSITNRKFSSINKPFEYLKIQATAQKKTTVNSGTESKIFERGEHEDSTSKRDIACTTLDEHGNDKLTNKQTTKTMEIETSKGLLSVTTTIEDSKINDVILEKTETMPTTKTAVKTDNDRITDAKDTEKMIGKAATPKKFTALPNTLMSSTKAKKAAKLQEAKAEVMGAAAVAADVAKTTVASAAAVVKELLTKKDVLSSASTYSEDKTKSKTKPRVRVDLNRSSLERNFITPARAMSDFLLKPVDLENLPKIKRRSPYEQEPPMTVYWRKDVEAKAIEVWGSRENLLKETLRREVERKQHQQNIFTVKRRLRDYRREIGYRVNYYKEEPGLRGKSGQVVLIAIGINSINFLFKGCAWLYTGSHSLFAETIHSLADTINQLILAYGIHKSTQIADPDHPYGYTNMRYVSSLISGVGIFCVGTGLSFYHGITGLLDPTPMADFFWAFFILGGSFVSEGATLLVAINEVKRSAKLQNVTFKEYVLSGKDPCVNVVITEDAAAVASVGVAATCMGLSQFTGSPVFDALGSLFVGGILGMVASFIIYTNVQALVGKSISEERLNKINAELESDIMIRAIHDVKGIDMGSSLVRYKAEMDFDGRELTRSYLDKQDLNELLKVVKSFQTVEELEQFLLTHGENIVDLMGGEIDRIEMKLRKKFPEIRHCDLEIL